MGYRPGARVSGLDASAALLGVARGQLADADLRVGDIEELPYDDATFDVVTAATRSSTRPTRRPTWPNWPG
jgi:ubiquinone/menaquinone biosynthesis C-methylase UbiE